LPLRTFLKTCSMLRAADSRAALASSRGHGGAASRHDRCQARRGECQVRHLLYAARVYLGTVRSESNHGSRGGCRAPALPAPNVVPDGPNNAVGARSESRAKSGCHRLRRRDLTAWRLGRAMTCGNLRYGRGKNHLGRRYEGAAFQCAHPCRRTAYGKPYPRRHLKTQ